MSSKSAARFTQAPQAVGIANHLERCVEDTLHADFAPKLAIKGPIVLPLANDAHHADEWLGRAAHDPQANTRSLREALINDVADIQGGTTREGIHLGAMAGTVDLLQRCYTGLELREDVLWLNPRLPRGVRRLACGSSSATAGTPWA